MSGTSGTSGATGVSGTSGTSGATGTSGTSGSVGATGTSGTSGATGTSGTSGSVGATGTSGTSGATGTSGTSGSEGPTGSSGTSGANGSSGITGAGYIRVPIYHTSPGLTNFSMTPIIITTKDFTTFGPFTILTITMEQSGSEAGSDSLTVSARYAQSGMAVTYDLPSLDDHPQSQFTQDLPQFTPLAWSFDANSVSALDRVSVSFQSSGNKFIYMGTATIE